MDERHYGQQDFVGAAGDGAFLPTDYEPARPAHFDVASIILAKTASKRGSRRDDRSFEMAGTAVG